MLREGSLKDISDGRLYSENDLVRTDCQDCVGCHECCKGMDKTVVLDPYDVYQLMNGLQMNFDKLIENIAELSINSNMILPNIRMQAETSQCYFLNDKGRCSIHKFRPGVCRLFPLGRYWDEAGDFHYILQTGQCMKEPKVKIKVKKWLGIQNLSQYNAYLKQWHDYVLYVRGEIDYINKKCEKLNSTGDTSFNEEARKQIMYINMYTLNTFFKKEYNSEAGFFDEFAQRMTETKELFGL